MFFFYVKKACFIINIQNNKIKTNKVSNQGINHQKKII